MLRVLRRKQTKQVSKHNDSALCKTNVDYIIAMMGLVLLSQSAFGEKADHIWKTKTIRVALYRKSKTDMSYRTKSYIGASSKQKRLARICLN